MDRLNSKDLCRIIEACRKNNVSILKFSGVEIKFHTHQGLPTIEDLPKTPFEAEEKTSLPEQKVSMTPVEKHLLEDIRMSQLMTEDPEAFEQEIVDGFMGRNRALEHAEFEDRRA